MSQNRFLAKHSYMELMSLYPESLPHYHLETLAYYISSTFSLIQPLVRIAVLLSEWHNSYQEAPSRRRNHLFKSASIYILLDGEMWPERFRVWSIRHSTGLQLLASPNNRLRAVVNNHEIACGCFIRIVAGHLQAGRMVT